MKYERVLEAFNRSPWAILPEKLIEIQAVIELRAGGGKLSEADLEMIKRHQPEARIVEAAGGKGRSKGRVAIVPVFGVMAQRLGLMSEMSGGVSTERLSQRIEALGNDSQVRAIILNVDSPGGSCFGVQELANRIHSVAQQKRVVAVANSTMASAAYWISSQASEVVASPSAVVGSIGVVSAHIDQSKFDETVGVKTTLVSAGKHKVEGNPFEPLTEEAREAMQLMVDAYYDRFVAAVGRGRGASDKDVREGFGEGRVLTSQSAKSEKLVDRIATLREVLEREGVDPSHAAEVAALYEIPSSKAKAQPSEPDHRKRELQLSLLDLELSELQY